MIQDTVVDDFRDLYKYTVSISSEHWQRHSSMETVGDRGRPDYY